jgi:hypothetical protein
VVLDVDEARGEREHGDTDADDEAVAPTVMEPRTVRAVGQRAPTGRRNHKRCATAPRVLMCLGQALRTHHPDVTGGVPSLRQGETATSFRFMP